MIIFSYKISNELISDGFKLLRCEPSKSDSNKVVFVFENSIALFDKLKEYGIDTDNIE